MKYRRVALLLVLHSFILICSIGVKPVQAQQIDLTLAPSSIELLIKPGAQVKVPFTLSNRSDEVSFSPSIKTFRLAGDGKSVEYGSAEGLPIKTSFYDETSNLVSGLTLKKGESKKIFMDLVVPKSTSEGDYYLAFIAETQPERIDKQYSIRVKAQIAAPLLITISRSGTTEAKGTIDIFEVSRKVYDSFDSIPVKLHLQNLGKNVVYAGGTITVRGPLGEKAVYSLENHNILSHSGRDMVSKLAQGDYATVLKGFFIGRYTVSANVTLGDGAVQLSRSTSFFAFPFKIIFVAVLSAVVGLIIIRKRR